VMPPEQWLSEKFWGLQAFREGDSGHHNSIQ
jgi:hypothetical protein